MPTLTDLLRHGNYAVSLGPAGMHMAAIETVEGGAVQVTVHKQHPDGTAPLVHLPGLDQTRTYAAPELETLAATLGFTDWQVK